MRPDVEGGVLPGGEDRGQRPVAEKVLELAGSDGAEPGELRGGGVGVVGEVGEVDDEVDVGADALVLRQAGLQDRREQGVEGGDAALGDGSVVLGARGRRQGGQDGLELGAGVEGQEPGHNVCAAFTIVSASRESRCRWSRSQFFTLDAPSHSWSRRSPICPTSST